MKSQLMTQAELARLQASGKTLEQDERGVKVTLLPDGKMLKVFRLRRWFSSGLVYSNARRFCRNAERLQQRGIATVSDCELFHFAKSTDKAVIYQPLAGDTIRDLLKLNQLSHNTYAKLGCFIADLHRYGIYFKSLHFGNIVLTPIQELGLIDISDMRFYPWQLHCNTRLRSLNRMYRYADDIRMLGVNGWADMLTAYFSKSLIDFSCKKRIETVYPRN